MPVKHRQSLTTLFFGLSDCFNNLGLPIRASGNHISEGSDNFALLSGLPPKPVQTVQYLLLEVAGIFFP